jgi:hypothetical protein
MTQPRVLIGIKPDLSLAERPPACSSARSDSEIPRIVARGGFKGTTNVQAAPRFIEAANLVE